MLCYITHDYVMLYNTQHTCYVIKHMIMLCYITDDMLCYITDDMLCYITHVMLCYITHVMLYYITHDMYVI